MARAPRPSDIYRLPDSEAGDDQPSPAEPPRRGRNLLAAGIVAAGLAAVALLAGGEATTGQVVAVDVVAEEEAVAALDLFLHEHQAASDLRSAADILRPPGPGQAARDIDAHARALSQTLREARARPGGDPRAAAYWSDPAHDDFLHLLREVGELAADIGLLAAVHDTVYAGAGAVGFQEAEHALVNRFRAGRPAAAELSAWSDTLLAELEGHDAAAEAGQARMLVEGYWAHTVARLEPAAVDLLHEYVAALPPDLLDILRGHPVVTRAIDRLQA